MRGTWKSVAVALVAPLSLGTVVPSIQWCPVGWDQVQSACFLECTAVPVQACSAMDAECAASPECSSAGTSCPLEVSEPDEATTTDTAERGPHPDARTPAGRAYCLDDPAGATLPRPSHPTTIDPPSLAALLAPVVDLDAPPARHVGPPPRLLARPPTRAWTPVPPSRAPPAERVT